MFGNEIWAARAPRHCCRGTGGRGSPATVRALPAPSVEHGDSLGRGSLALQPRGGGDEGEGMVAAG